jgi:hypothetical protein
MPLTNEDAGLGAAVYATLIGEHYGLLEAPDLSRRP